MRSRFDFAVCLITMCSHLVGKTLIPQAIYIKEPGRSVAKVWNIIDLLDIDNYTNPQVIRIHVYQKKLMSRGLWKYQP